MPTGKWGEGVGAEEGYGGTSPEIPLQLPAWQVLLSPLT